MDNANCFFISIPEQDIKKEKEKARELRKSRWWQQKLSAGRCYYCQGRFARSELTMDHVVPIARGGKSVKNNLVTACKECNSKKKYLLPMEWREYLNGVLIKPLAEELKETD